MRLKAGAALASRPVSYARTILHFCCIGGARRVALRIAALLAWAAEQDRIFVTHDLKTIPRYAYERIEVGRSMPGVIAIPKDLPIGQAIEEMVIIIECCAANEFENEVFYLPV